MGKSKKKDKKDKKGKGKKDKKGKKHKKMTTKKKVMIGAGIAALAIGATAGGLYLAKQQKNKAQHGKLLSSDLQPGSRGISNLGSCQLVDDPRSTMATIPSPDAITVGLCWDTHQSGQANMDLLASVFNAYGQNLGYIQGAYCRSLFNNAIWHSGDDVKGGTKSDLTSLTGDNENIVIDFNLLPQEASCIILGVLLVQAQSQLSKADCHISPLLRADQIQSSAGESPGTRGVVGESDSGTDSDSDSDSEPEQGTRAISSSGSVDDDELIKIFQADLEQLPAFPYQRGFVAGRFFRTGPSQWSWNPLRQVVQADPQAGIWPVLEYYGKPS